jgi:hypothetical protein
MNYNFQVGKRTMLIEQQKKSHSPGKALPRSYLARGKMDER